MSESDAPATDAPQAQGGTPPADGGADVDWKAEAEKWKALSRQHEERGKSTFAELEKFRKASMSEAEKAVAEAKEQGRSEGRRESAERIAAADIRAALAGVVTDPAGVAADLNVAKFIDESGETDQKAVKALVERYQKLAPKPATDLKQGALPSGAASETGDDWMRRQGRAALHR